MTIYLGLGSLRRGWKKRMERRKTCATSSMKMRWYLAQAHSLSSVNRIFFLFRICVIYFRVLDSQFSFFLCCSRFSFQWSDYSQPQWCFIWKWHFQDPSSSASRHSMIFRRFANRTSLPLKSVSLSLLCWVSKKFSWKIFHIAFLSCLDAYFENLFVCFTKCKK